MPPVQLRSLPDEVYEQLAQAAKEDDRSITQQATFLIKQGLAARNAQPHNGNGSPRTGTEPLTPTPIMGVIDERTGEVFPNHQARRKALFASMREERESGRWPSLNLTAEQINEALREDLEERTDRILSCLS
ncbi:MAG: hypothetical protein FWE46_06460 [Coriobacteriia bacterium]|nr:hypothetical protein [Coriobacteriia bacterium]MCL2537634.1 hypothetical protein [Coriobacteriia bacterium]